MSTPGVSAWFQLADSNGFIFNNTLCNDVIIRGTLASQNVHVGGSPGARSTLTVTESSVSVVGDIFTSRGNLISDTGSIDVNGITLSNNTVFASNVIASHGAEINGPLNASSLIVAGVMIVDDRGAFATSNIPNASLTNDKIEDRTIQASKFAIGAVDTLALGYQSVTSEKFAPGAVDTTALSNQSLTSEKFFPGSVDAIAIGTQTIHSFHFWPEAVDTFALKTKAVTTEKLGHDLTLYGTTTAKGKVRVNIDNSDTDAAVEVSGPICLTSNNGSISIYSSSNRLGINNPNPAFTLDVGGDLNIAGTLYTGTGSNTTKWTPSQWTFEPPFVNGSGCNISYKGGYCGIGTSNVRSLFHVNGTVTVASNICFDNPYKMNAIILSTYQSNLGINEPVPTSTLDIGGSIAIRNQEIFDVDRNIKNVKNASMTSLVVNQSIPSSLYVVDVGGDMRLDASRLVMNPYAMRISTKGSIGDNDEAFYKIIDLKSGADVGNFGSVVIRGDIGNISYDSSGFINVVIGTRNAQITSEPLQSVAHVTGGTPTSITPFIDLFAFKNLDDSYSIYVWVRPGSYFTLDVHGGPIISSLYPDWKTMKTSSVPSGTYVKSLLNEENGTACLFSGVHRFGNNMIIAGDVTASHAILQGCTFKDAEGAVSNLTFDIHRSPSSTAITTNAILNTGSRAWYSQDVDKTALQLVTDASKAMFMFNIAEPSANTALAFSNVVSITRTGVGIFTVAPQAKLHIEGNMSLGNESMIQCSSCNHDITLGYFGNPIVKVTKKNKVGINKTETPLQTLDVGGHANVDGALTFADALASSKRIVNFTMTIENMSATNAKWIKVARFRPSVSTPFCQGLVCVRGTLANESDGMSFEVIFNINASSSGLCTVQSQNTIHTTNYLKNIFDIVCYVDHVRAVHVYVKSSASFLVANLEFTFSQSFGSGVNIYTDTSFTGIPFSDMGRQVATLDSDVVSPILFIVGVQSSLTQFVTFTKAGSVGFGTDNPSSRVHVVGTTTTTSLTVTDGVVKSSPNVPLSFNGNPLITSDGLFITSNIPNASIMLDKLAPATVSNIIGLFTVSNFYPQTNAIGIFNPNPAYELDVKGRIAIASQSNGDQVVLQCSASNGLGINKVPGFMLDVAGDINFDGTIRHRGSVFKTSQWTSDIASNISFESNVAIGTGITPSFDTPLVVLNAFSLSNPSGSSRFVTMSNRLGINLSNPTSTLDVGGGIAVSNVPIIDGERNLFNIETISAAALTTTSSRIGINNVNPQFEVDVVGDINMTGKLLKNGIVYISSQWVGSNDGITYGSQVGIGEGISPSTQETLCVLQSLSLSNTQGKIVLSLSDSNTLTCGGPLTTSTVALSNSSGSAVLYHMSNNIGIGTKSPLGTLDVNGTIAAGGKPFVNPYGVDGLTLSNVNCIYTPHLTLTPTRMGLGGVRNPIDTLTLAGSIGLSNSQSYARLSTFNNLLSVQASGMMASNVIVAGMSTSSPVLHVSSTLSNIQNDLVRIAANLPSLALWTTTKNNAALVSFIDSTSNVIGRFGLDGNGFTNVANSGIITLWTSNNDIRFATRGLTRARITSSGNVGFGTDVPSFTVDIGGTGLGVAGTQVLDVNRNLYVASGSVTSLFSARNLSSGVTTNIRPSNLDIMITSAIPANVGVRSTAVTNTNSYSTFSNIVFGNPGRVVLVYNSNMYFTAVDPMTGNTAYMNYAFQPLVQGSDLPNIAALNLDAFVLNNSNVLNFVGNAKIAASSWEIVNPEGTSTTFRIRHWNHSNIYNSASITNSNFVEMKLDSYGGKVNTDHDLSFCVNDTPVAKISRSDLSMWVTSLKANTLMGTGTKPVYADAMGQLTQSVSDVRAKKDITTLDHGLDVIEKLRPVTFKWREPFNKTRGDGVEIGMIAQEVKHYAPECVGQNDDGLLYVDYCKIIPILVRAVQELKKENMDLKDRIQRLCSTTQ